MDYNEPIRCVVYLPIVYTLCFVAYLCVSMAYDQYHGRAAIYAFLVKIREDDFVGTATDRSHKTKLFFK